MKYKTNSEGIRIAYFEKEDFTEEQLDGWIGNNLDSYLNLPIPFVFIHNDDVFKLLGLEENKTNKEVFNIVYDVCKKELANSYEKYECKIWPLALETPNIINTETNEEYISEGIYYMMRMQIGTDECAHTRVWWAFTMIPQTEIWAI
jgi:hypothetical protein